MLISRTPFVDFSEATFRTPIGPELGEPPHSILWESLLYRPALFRRNQIRWIAACAWRSRSRARGLAALKGVKQAPTPSVISKAAMLVSTLINEIYGEGPAEAITCVPCGHSQRADCFGKQLAQLVAAQIEIPFLQIFADRPCEGVSHPKQHANLPPLQLIAAPPRSVIVIDDLATSGWHLEEAALALRSLGVAASSMAWISGRSGGIPYPMTPATQTRVNGPKSAVSG